MYLFSMFDAMWSCSDCKILSSIAMHVGKNAPEHLIQAKIRNPKHDN